MAEQTGLTIKDLLTDTQTFDRFEKYRELVDAALLLGAYEEEIPEFDGSKDPDEYFNVEITFR